MSNNYCDNAQVLLSTDDQGRTWEHFNLGNNYIFSNQIPNRQSFTTTNPGQVIYQRGFCQWSAQPSIPMQAQTTPAMAPGEGGAIGLLLLLGIAGSGIYAWYTKAKPDWSSDYHPMADVPPLPTVYLEPSTANRDMPGHAQGDMADPSPFGVSPAVADDHRQSQPPIAMGSSVPWDEPENDGDDTATDDDDENETVIDDNLPVFDDGSPYSLDKLKGVSMQQFKGLLASQGITPESGCFKSIELLQHPGASLFVERRMRAFWQEFGSTRIPHAVYFVFGLQSGGGRSAEFKQQYAEAKLWISNWFKENLPHE
ncbi:MAG: hypothetical protein WBG32_00125 [Nodosilinea sp.]